MIAEVQDGDIKDTTGKKNREVIKYSSRDRREILSNIPIKRIKMLVKIANLREEFIKAQ